MTTVGHGRDDLREVERRIAREFARLSAYLVTDREDGITVYRLIHDVLRSTLRERSRDLLDTGPR
jgi:hypothetical protein